MVEQLSNEDKYELIELQNDCILEFRDFEKFADCYSFYAYYNYVYRLIFVHKDDILPEIREKLDQFVQIKKLEFGITYNSNCTIEGELKLTIPAYQAIM